MKDTCRSCGESGCRIDATFTLGELSFADPYCGACGVNWGVFMEAIHDASRHGRRKKSKLRAVKQEATR